MSVSPKLPPTGRDFIVYQRVVVDGASTRMVAEEAGVSQTRVRQIVIRVMQWLVETLPADTELSEAAQLRLAQHIAADRLERFYVEANRYWQHTTQPKFAYLCLRVMAAQSKLAAQPGTLEALAMDAIIGPLPDDVGQTFLSAKENVGQTFLSANENKATPSSRKPSAKSAAASAIEGKHKTADKNVCPTSAPPLRDCSPGPSSEAATAETSSSVPVATPSAPEPCDKLPPAARAARRAFLAPAHLPNDHGKEAPVTEIKITPQTLGLSTKKNLSRKERRRLRRKAMTK